MGDGVKGFDLPANVVIEDDLPGNGKAKYLCPKCHGRLQYTISKLGNFDEETGDPLEEFEWDIFTVYCENDCCLPIELRDDRLSGEIALDAICTKLGLPYPGGETEDDLPRHCHRCATERGVAIPAPGTCPHQPVKED